MKNAEALRDNYKNLAYSIIRENIRNEHFRRSRWCSTLLSFFDMDKLPPLKPKKEIKQKFYILEFKKSVAKEYDDNPLETIQKLSEKYGVVKSTVLRWLEEYSTRYQDEQSFKFEE